jgi:hypothetical protein
MRSRVVLEIAAELVSVAVQPHRQAKVLLRDQHGGETTWPISLLGSSTISGLLAVVRSEATLAMVNPSAILTLAYKGSHPFIAPLPLRTIGVIPSLDQFLFAVRPEFGIKTLEEIGRRKLPLRIAMRGQDDHSIHTMFAHIVAAAGFSVDDLGSWGGKIHKLGGVPRAGGPQFRALDEGEIDAIFDEGVDLWIQSAIDRGMTILGVSEETVRALEAMGYRRAILQTARYTKLPNDVLTLDFSGWPIFVREDLSSEIVTMICAALDARKHLIPWEQLGPLPVERMCRESPDTPMDVPLHEAAKEFWRSKGYL